MNISVQKITKSNRNDFSKLHCEKNGEGWCNCVAWWVPTWNGWGERTAEQNLKLRNELFDQGEYDDYILYTDGELVAWCQCGPRDRLKKLVSQYSLEPSSETWAITCFVVIPSHRNKGLVRKLLEGVLTDLKEKGVHHVQGFPKRGDKLEPGEMWTGPESLFQSTGFSVEKDHPKIPVYGLRL